MINSRQQQAAFTLLETVVVVAIFTILSGAVMDMIISLYRSHAYTFAQTSELYEARRGIEIMVRDVREMTFADDGQFPLVALASTSLSFFSDIDRDNSVELVELVLEGTTLNKYTYDAIDTVYSTSSPSATYQLSEYVQNTLEGEPIFRYYDEAGTEVTDPSLFTDVRYVEMNVIVNVDPLRNPGQYSIRSSAALRNIIETY